MKSSHNNERGAVLIIELIVLAIVLGVAGIAVVRFYEQKRSANPAASPIPRAVVKTPSKAYLVIKEMSIRLPLSEDIADLTYHFDPETNIAALSSKTLAEKTGGTCSAGPGVGPLESLHRTKDPPNGSDPERIKRVNGYYIWRTPPQAACSTDISVIEIVSKQRTAVHQAVDAAEPL